MVISCQQSKRNQSQMKIPYFQEKLKISSKQDLLRVLLNPISHDLNLLMNILELFRINIKKLNSSL
jgi:hypothetical protein